MVVGRCAWCGTDPLYVAYHDTEWGVPERDARALWEKLVLDGFQAGLSWITILRKRDNFREEFEGFDPERVAGWDEARIARALQNPGIIRHRGKIAATVKGARLFLQIEAAEGFAPFLWSFTGGGPILNRFETSAEVPTATPESIAMSKALKKRGFNFCGPVITYAFMEATGMVNDHVTTCHRHAAITRMSVRE
ncbi:MAG: DNA-3-methyladenine glycosylase I [Paracoccus sp. (in: a-proteobacteria)]|jgi:DNA-3-methyladenine glycosylase I|uniref:DNA-3-methyladenine glycosylase I n=1 Tax=unclassified Paracoccus (in: a-proteobacteria) TaxID=2688777 RepID=UPI000C4772D9|nr:MULTISPECIES: DNA-3-methyladenine glycosylase I [unclassified Paracoccus (in: a-proteobacteria)]MAN57606.1 DNA-3-methyladenine glycosylase I [Paracoccus sp. (in: a-proteobacteria)]MBA49086.1 DNA-3-methyladenine glycosylase I [Paracoccus sp. (in: a-proteobacteria)]MDB2551814.1 DNA-3-methyladenine glycosylase I [Paracoccus sp. (in: a-proteobacteria)]HIC64919.1 DNA-3-methyladenine glycosylase I [Paracoccus sp. (in: a-proteobacteria)]|tara:strand:- start:4457 stop:5038 length:582 start_codon:yes stop_codon:yes gene_type:complete